MAQKISRQKMHHIIDHKIVFLKSGDHNYVARIDPRTKFRMGDKVQITFNMGNMHIFDKETEMAIR